MPGIIKAKPNEEDADAPAGLPPFPVDSLPPLLAAMTKAIAETTGVPLDICGPCVLGTASACLGRGLLVHSSPGCKSAPNLYILVVKPSGAGGSKAYEFATAPLRGYEATAMREYDEVTRPRMERKRDTLKSDYDEKVAARRQLKKAGEDTAMIEAELDALQVERAAVEAQIGKPFFITNDGTSESFAPLLARRKEVLAHFDSDANDSVGLILGTRYGKSDHTNDSLHLKAYSGESLAIIRKGTAKGGSVEIFLRRPTLACLFIITPDVARKLFGEDRMMTGGLLPRFLVVTSRTKPLPWGDDRKIATDVSRRYEAAAFALLNTYRDRAADEMPAIGMTEEARELFAANWQEFCDGFTPDFSAFAARHTENATRIALVLHAWQAVSFEPDGMGETVARCSAHELQLEGKTARDALTIAEWFERHQTEILAPMREAARDEKFEKVQARCESRDERIVTARDLVAQRIAATAEEADKLLATWEQEGLAFREQVEAKPGAGAKPRKPRYRIKRRRRA